MSAPTHGYVYIIGPSVVKIGSARDVDVRLRELQVGSPMRLAVIWSAYVPEPRKIEKLLHAEFHRTKDRGEWFNAEPDMISRVEGILEEKQPVPASVVRKHKPKSEIAPPKPKPSPSALIRDILSIWPAGQDRLRSAEIAKGLQNLPDYYWKPEAAIYKMIPAVLKPIGINSRAIKFHGKTFQGYRRADFTTLEKAA
jgi:Meiotically up-regulated gene 113